MSGDLFLIRNGDGAAIGPASGKTIAVMISEGAITADAFIVTEQGLVPLTREATFAEALGRVSEGLAEEREQARVTKPVDPSFAGLLIELWRRKATGVLEVEADGVRTTIYLLEGTPMFAANGALSDTLGQLLVRTERITEEQLEKALEHYLERYAGKQKRMGEVLLELGMLTPDELAEALHLQTREKILACFRSEEQRYRFEADAEAVMRMPRFPCSVPSLVEASKRPWTERPRSRPVRMILAAKGDPNR